MYYTESKLKKMGIENDHIEAIIKEKIIDKSNDIKKALKDTLLKIGVPYEKVFDDFLFELEKVILKDGAFDAIYYNMYEKELFNNNLKIKLVKASTFAKESDYCYTYSTNELGAFNRCSFIRLIANEKYCSKISNCSSSVNNNLELLKHKYNLSITKTKERCDSSSFDSYKEIFLGNIKKIDNKILLVLNQDEMSAVGEGDSEYNCKYTLYIVI